MGACERACAGGSPSLTVSLRRDSSFTAASSAESLVSPCAVCFTDVMTRLPRAPHHTPSFEARGEGYKEEERRLNECSLLAIEWQVFI